jgi:hypothetical protein
MNKFYDHNDLFHWLAATRSCIINMLSCSFSNLDSRLVKTLTSYGSLFSLSLDGNNYFIGSNGCDPYTS